MGQFAAGCPARCSASRCHPRRVAHRYYVVVTAENQAGLTSSLWSAPVVADDTPPSLGRVVDGTNSNGDVECVFDDQVFTASFTPFEDGTSGVTGYEVAVGTTPAGLELMDWTDAGTGAGWGGHASVSVAVAEPLPVGSIVFFAVRATNAAGLQSVVSSNGVHVQCAGGATDPTCVDMSRQRALCVNTFTCPAGGCPPEGVPGSLSGGATITQALVTYAESEAARS